MFFNYLGYNNTLVLFGDREGKMSYLDLGPSEILEHEEGCDKYTTRCGIGLTGIVHTNEADDLEEPSAIHLLPNILIGTGKYCRSCKYHDKAVDTAYLTDNGYLITASAGSIPILLILLTVLALYNNNKFAMLFVDMHNIYVINV